MKVKNNTENLITRHLTGGLIPKFKEPYHRISRQNWDEFATKSKGIYKNRQLNKAWSANGYTYRAVADKNGQVNVYRWKGYANDPQYGTEARKKAGNKYAYVDQSGRTYRPVGNNIYEYEDSPGIYNVFRLNSGEEVTPNHYYSSNNTGDTATTYDNLNRRFSVTYYDGDKWKSSDWKNYKSGTQGKPAGTLGNDTIDDSKNRAIGTDKLKSNSSISRTTTVPTSTFAESPTNITDQNWLTARNNAMTRGWGSYVYNGLTYTFKGEDLDNAKNNWRINRGRLNNEALGLLGIATSENKPVETTLPAITLADTDRVLAEVDANIKANSPRLLLVNDGMYGALSALKNPGASVAGLSYARLSGNKGVGEYNKQNTSPAFYDLITNWYANNKSTINNYLNNSNYSQDFNLSVLNFLDRYKLYRPKYTFARKGSKLILRNK